MLVALHAALAWLGRGITLGLDESRYLVLARSLQQGHYQQLMWPGTPLERMYPPGFPALLAIWSALGGERLDWLVLLNIALSAATITLAFASAKREFGRPLALCALAILAVNPELLASAGSIMSEPSLGFCFAAAVYLAVCVPPGGRQAALMIGVSVAAVLMRSFGIVLCAAVVVAWVLDGRRREAKIAAAVFVLVVAPLLFWTMDPQAPAGSSYAGDLAAGERALHPAPVWRMLAARVGINAIYYPTIGIPWTFPAPTIPKTLIDNAVATLFLTSGLAAGLVAGVRNSRVGALVLVFSAGLLLVWPYQLTRYLAPLLPILVPVLLGGLAIMSRVLRLRPVLVVGISAFLAVSTGASRVYPRLVAKRSCERGGEIPDPRCLQANRRGFFPAALYVRDSLPRGAVVVAYRSTLLYLYSGRQSLPLDQLPLDSGNFWRAVRLRAQYILAEPEFDSASRLLPALLAAECSRLELVATFQPGTALFRVLPEQDASSRADGSRACEAVDRYERQSRALLSAEAAAVP